MCRATLVTDDSGDRGGEAALRGDDEGRIDKPTGTCSADELSLATTGSTDCALTLLLAALMLIVAALLAVVAALRHRPRLTPDCAASSATPVGGEVGVSGGDGGGELDTCSRVKSACAAGGAILIDKLLRLLPPPALALVPALGGVRARCMCACACADGEGRLPPTAAGGSGNSLGVAVALFGTTVGDSSAFAFAAARFSGCLSESRLSRCADTARERDGEGTCRKSECALL